MDIPVVAQFDQSLLEPTTSRRVKQTEEVNPIIDFLQSVVVALVISIVVYLFVLTPSQIDGNSMDPNFENGQRVFTNRLPQWFAESGIGKKLDLDFERGDVIVFQKPGMENPLVKRVIGLPGEKVEIKDNHYYIDGLLLDEEYIDYKNYPTKGGTFILEEDLPRTIPEDYYFVSGDNRPISNDSRYVQVGFVHKDWIKGKVVFSIWPLNTLGIIKKGKSELEEEN